ncbi:MAG: hypothetical protein PHH54_06680 [Candidatus Nanoarchaeia archaeon]|nr:hypothetical protein [Candidatus Nanoarchaeia archaeon]MDD5741640.1 hypothetical protein [Candidatus Nanoarchaeia archaeon]
MKKLNILFICRANCFRSKVAEAYFNRINKNKNIKAKSAGVVAGYRQGDFQVEAAKELGINIKGKSRGINANLLKWTDILVDVADDVPAEIFDYEKKRGIIKYLIVWNIKDVKTTRDIDDDKRVIRQVMEKVNKLNKQLENLRQNGNS